MRIERRRFVILSILQIALIFLTILYNAGAWLCMGLSVWMWAMVLYSSKLYDNIELITFLGCFFVFTFGGQVASAFLGYQYKTEFSAEIETHTNILLLISVIFLLLGYSFAKIIHHKRHLIDDKHFVRDNNYMIIARKISRWMFFFTAIFWYMLLIEKIIYNLEFGYFSLYADYSSKLPRIIRTFDNFAPVAFYIFLGTNPSKKEAKLPLIVYSVYLLLSLLTGRRIHVAVGLIILVIYFVIRDHFSEEKWITRRMKIAAVFALPTFIVMLQLFGSIRLAEDTAFSGIWKTIVDFIGNQGVTVNVIKYGYQYDGQFGHDKFYSLYNTLRFLRVSPLTNWFMPAYDFTYGTYTAQTALNGNSFANIITYQAMPSIFLKGGGLGSCYVAELYYDFGYIGVCIGNIIYGYLLYLLSQNRNRGILPTAISFIILESLLKTPRYNFDLVISDLTMISNWIFIFFLFILIRCARRIS